MLRKSFVFILLVVSTCALAFAQTAPTEPKKPREFTRTLVAGVPFDGSYLGVQTKEVSKENMAQFGLNEVRGVAIEKVLENSPAAKAGLMNNDVIVRFNGEEVTSVRKLTRLIGEVAPDHTAKITVLRNGAERDFDVTMGKREVPQFFDGNFKFENFPPLATIPEMPNFPKGELPQLKEFPQTNESSPKAFVFTTGSNRQIGIGVTGLTKQLGDYFGVAEGKGLLINSVRENSPAAKAGLRAGDIIVEIEGKEVKGNGDLIRAINEKKEGDVTLTIIRDKNRQTISVTPEVSKDGNIRFGEGLEKIYELNPIQMNLQMTMPEPRVAPFDFQITTAPRILE
jgi:membrane-associated protease RseP (regulator of RpoE activity)